MASHLSVPALRTRLEELDLPCTGKKPELQRRLRKALARIKAEEERIESGAPRDEELDLSTWRPKYTDYLVVDVEATCEDGKMAGFGYPNEIIELPVVLLRLPPSDSSEVEPQLTDTFHTFVRPIFQPVLTQFCKTLTGVTQAQVDSAPSFPQALSLLYHFLRKHDLLDATSASLPSSNGSKMIDPFLDPFSAEHRSSLKRNVMFCSHGPFDIRDFIPKACWMNAFTYGPPVWLRKCSILDVRKATLGLVYVGRVDERGGEGARLASHARVELEAPSRDGGEAEGDGKALSPSGSSAAPEKLPRRIDSTIPGLLLLLHLEPFQGQLHSGLDDTRNLARVVAEVVRRVIAGARSWSDESRWDEPLEEEQAPSQGRLEDEEQKVLDGLANVSLDGDISNGTPKEGQSGHGPKPASQLPATHRRPRATPVPLAPHIRDQLLTPNVYLPEYPPPPPAPSTLSPASKAAQGPLSASASNLLPSARSNGPARVAAVASNGQGQGRGQGQADQPFSGDECTARRLLKGGSVYYPKRWAWMGKKEGVVRWDSEGVGWRGGEEGGQGEGGGKRGGHPE